MLEKVGDKDIVVRNYTDNFNIKEFIQDELIPEAFPDIPMTRLNLGFTGIVSEYMGQAIEDVQGEASVLTNEAFITKAVLPESIYAEAAVYELGYRFATPSVCNFALELKLDHVLEASEEVQGENDTFRYKLDKDTKLVLGNNTYRLDYDIWIDHTYINGRLVFNVYYDMSEKNSISDITNKYIKHQVASSGWLVLFMDLKQFDRKTDYTSITDNIITTNSDIEISWIKQIAGLDAVYISPQGQRLQMKLKPEYTSAEVEPFAWYRFIDDNTIALSFTSEAGYWAPEFNSQIEYTVYTCLGEEANFVSYDRKSGVPVTKTGERFLYNTDTEMVALCFSGSVNGTNRGDIEILRSDIIKAKNTVDVISTDNDLQAWFDNHGKVYGTKSEFFKRRDDPTGRLFSQFICISDGTYIYPTNTCNIKVTQDQFDFVNSSEDGLNQEFIIKPGHLWEYDGDSKDTLVMVTAADGPCMVTDESLPSISEEHPFMFTNPFFIKIHRDPTTSMMYNYLLNHTSWLETQQVQTDSFYQFQLGTFSIERTISAKYNDMYHIEVLCVPVITTDTETKYIEGIGEDYPVSGNNLRLILVSRTSLDGETGYIEMTPVEEREGGGILFECNIAVKDNLRADMMLEIDYDRTPDMKSLITEGSREGKIFLDSSDTSFGFITLMKDSTSKNILYGDERYTGYTLTNRFLNNNRDLQLYKPMSMMRSMIKFSGTNNNYTVDMSLVPFLRYDIPLDDEKMSYFSQVFSEQYRKMEPVLSKLDGNSFLDFKLYNTYGRSTNYYIGPEEGVPNLKDSTILLDNVYVNVSFIVSVFDRSMYTQTVSEIINQISTTFNTLNKDDTDIHVSDIIHDIVENLPNVRYLRFIGFNNFDANKQSIFVKYSDISELDTESLMTRVPEVIRADENSIFISEET